MCGIYISKTNNCGKASLISHRGVEKNIIFIPQKKQVLTHYRLPIQTDLNGDGTQPARISNGIFLLFNGEIFNYDTKKYKSDTDFLSALFSKYNKFDDICNNVVPILNNLDGFWSIVIYDLPNNVVTLITDPLSKKQLYYNESGEISSEIKPLLNKESKIDEVFISQVLKWGYNTDNRTVFQNIKRVPPNTIMQWNLDYTDRKTTYSEYFDWRWKGKITTYKKAQATLRNLLIQSIKRRLMYKGESLSVLVSGGLDSSIIVSLIMKYFKDVKKIHWLTIFNDEDKYINILEKYLKIKIQRLEFNINKFFKENKIPEIYCKHNESPVDLGSVLPQYFLFKKLSEEDTSPVVIAGDGSDELFGGYSRSEKYDSQKSDIFDEVVYYHLPRLDKLSMAFTKELRSPYLSHDLVRFALAIPYKWRVNKKILKDTFHAIIPQEIIEREKKALKIKDININELNYRKKIVKLFLDSYQKYLAY